MSRRTGKRAKYPLPEGPLSKMIKHRESVDQPAAKELELWIENDGELYRRQYQPILKNLANKKARGIYDHAKAVKLFGYLAESGAKRYNGETGSGSGVGIFNPATRHAVAEQLAKQFETEYDLGNYEELKAKKYQGLRGVHDTTTGYSKKEELGKLDHSHRGMQVTEYCPRCRKYLKSEDIP